jgi:GNAT superfamily N-acetyltransferase
LTGSKDTNRKNKIFLSSIFPKVLAKFIFKGYIFKKKNLKFVFNAVRSFLTEKHSYKIPPLYPAHLHINVEEDFRRIGVGEKLMQAFFDYLKANDIHGVHLSTFSDQGRDFFIKCGFRVLWDGCTHQWHYLLGRDVAVATLGKLLDK